jgi:hypothetical protein
MAGPNFFKAQIPWRDKHAALLYSIVGTCKSSLRIWSLQQAIIGPVFRILEGQNRLMVKAVATEQKFDLSATCFALRGF